MCNIILNDTLSACCYCFFFCFFYLNEHDVNMSEDTNYCFLKYSSKVQNNLPPWRTNHPLKKPHFAVLGFKQPEFTNPTGPQQTDNHFTDSRHRQSAKKKKQQRRRPQKFTPHERMASARRFCLWEQLTSSSATTQPTEVNCWQTITVQIDLPIHSFHCKYALAISETQWWVDLVFCCYSLERSWLILLHY